MFPRLQDFLNALEAEGELLRIDEPVSPLLTITEIADRHAKAAAPTVSEAARSSDPDHCGLGGRALLFENVEGCDFPLAINVFGSYHRMELALGCAGRGGFEAIAERIGSLVKPEPPRSLGAAVRKGRELLPLLRIGPKRKRRGPCQEVVRLAERGEVDLTRGTAGGQGRFITFAGMHTIHADDEGAAKPSSHNVGMYRSQLLGPTRLAMHWHMHHDGAAHWRSWKRAGRPMPIAICLGGETVMPYAATAPLPPGISELLMAGFLNGRGIPLVRGRTVPLWVPANSEIVIEGYVSTECGFIDWDPSSGEPLGPGAVFEGPFGDHTGFYSLPDRYPIMEVTAVTHRRDAVYPSTIVGLPPQEDYYLGKATERVFLPLLRTLIHDIEDYHLPMFGCFHNAAFIGIQKSYPLQARRVMHAVWGAGQMAWTKMVVVVDEDVAIHRERAVLEAIFLNCHFGRDLELVNGPLDILDHAAPRLGAGHKIGIDATIKRAGEEVGGVPVEPAPATPGADAVRAMLGQGLYHGGIAGWDVPDFGFGRCVFVAVRKEQPGDGVATIETIWDAIAHAAPQLSAGHAADFVVVVDATVDPRDHDAVLFRLCANADPGRDLVRRGHRVGFDATTKSPHEARHGQPVRRFPTSLRMDESVVRDVDERREAFGV
jgi:4-hydroxy-3-polyprenylbenzoate decarboxylase